VGLFVLVGYAIAAVVFAIPIYLLLAIVRGDVTLVPGDRGDVICFLVVAGAFYVKSLLGAPGRLRSA
jgi:hypothetical protein